MWKISSVEQGMDEHTFIKCIQAIYDSFRRLFSKFTISTTSHQHVRISSARLEGPAVGLDGAKIVGCSAQKSDVVVSICFYCHRFVAFWCLLFMFEDSYTCTTCELLVLPRLQWWPRLVYCWNRRGIGTNAFVTVRESLSLLIKYCMLREGENSVTQG